MTAQNCWRSSLPEYSVEGSFILDRAVLEYNPHLPPTMTLTSLQCAAKYEASGQLTVTPLANAGSGTVAAEYGRLSDAIQVDCHLRTGYGSSIGAKLKVEVRQQSNEACDKVAVHEVPCWTHYAIPSPRCIGAFTIPCLSNVKLIPSLTEVHIKLSVTWRVNGMTTSKCAPTDSADRRGPKLIREDPQFIVKKLQALQSPPHKLSDVLFVVQKEEIPAHRVILAAMSPVFSSMFERDTKDRNSGRVKVDDASAKSFKKMLRSVYTAQEPEWESDEDLLELLYLSHKYALEPLQAQCARRMVATLRKNNFCKMLKAASVLKLRPVIGRIVDLVRTNKEVLRSEEWKKLRNDDPDVADEIYVMLV